jgi:hypothetical protein
MALTINLGDQGANELAYAIICEVMAFYGLDHTIDIVLEAFSDEDSNGDEARVLMLSEGSYLMGVNDSIQWTGEHLVELVAHEMVHVKQHEQDGFDIEVDATGSHTVSYRGKYYRMDNELEYWLSAWEMEARAMERFFLMRMAKQKWI